MVTFFKKHWQESPFKLILILAVFIRLLSVLFSKGYGMQDDHFLIIEPAQSWVDGKDNGWLPSASHKDAHPLGHSLFYVGLHYYFFLFLKIIGITGAQTKMYIVRLLHAAVSLLVVYYGYKITRKISNDTNAKMVGLLLAVFWFMPFFSVRNLVEVVCIAPLIFATWLVIKNGDNSEKKIGLFFFAGVILGIAFSIRFQTILFSAGMGLALLVRKQMWQGISMGLGFAACAVLIQGTIDYCIWQHPFVEFQEYVRYNIENRNEYFTQSWYQYFLVLGGLLIPPVSLMLLFGFFKNWKKHIYIFLPAFVFLVFHSYFPNKQERFILPIVPFIIISGYVGWLEFIDSSDFWQKRKKILAYSWIFFWSINLLLLSIVSVAYSKKNRVEAMTYIAEKKDVQAIIIEDSNRDNFLLAPMFYLEKWVDEYGVTKIYPAKELYKTLPFTSPKNLPNYVIFFQEENIYKRVAEFKQSFQHISYEAIIEPSFIDKVLHKLNPINKNQNCYIYKIQYPEVVH